MWILLALVCVAAAVAVAMTIVHRRRRRPSGGPPHPVDPFRDRDADALRGDPRALKAGDILDTQGESLVVRGTLRMREGGYQWAEHLIDTADGHRQWLSVEEDPDLELVLWRAVESEAPVPGPHTLEWGGVTYRLEESGQAQYTSEASTGLARSGTVQYYDYRSPDGSMLSYEDFRGSGSFEVATGRPVARHGITIYPRGTE